MKITQTCGILLLCIYQFLSQCQSIYTSHVKDGVDASESISNCPDNNESASNNCNIRSAIKRCGEEGHSSCIIHIDSNLQITLTRKIQFQTTSNGNVNLTVYGNNAVAAGSNAENEPFLYSNYSAFFVIHDMKFQEFGDFLYNCEVNNDLKSSLTLLQQHLAIGNSLSLYII